MEEIIKFLDKVLEALRTESKFKGDFKGHRVIVTNYNDQFAFYVDNHVVRDIPRVELVEMYLKQALSEIVLGKKVMDSNSITQWLIDNKVPFVERVMDSKGARTLILYSHTPHEAWLNLRRVKDAWNCEGQSTKFQRLEDSNTATQVLNTVKSYVYSVKDIIDMNLKKVKDSLVSKEFDELLRSKISEAIDNDFKAEGSTEFVITPDQVGVTEFTQDDMFHAQYVAAEMYEGEYDEGDGPQWDIDLKDGNLVIKGCYIVS